MVRNITENQVKFERDLLDVFDKYGYKTQGIQKLEIFLEVDERPKINLEYIQLTNGK